MCVCVQMYTHVWEILVYRLVPASHSLPRTVYILWRNWHPDDRVTRREMLLQASKSLCTEGWLTLYGWVDGSWLCARARRREIENLYHFPLGRVTLLMPHTALVTLSLSLSTHGGEFQLSRWQRGWCSRGERVLIMYLFTLQLERALLNDWLIARVPRLWCTLWIKVFCLSLNVFCSFLIFVKLF